METKKVIKKMILITIFSLIIIFLLQFIYLVPENRYRISDQTQEIINNINEKKLRKIINIIKK